MKYLLLALVLGGCAHLSAQDKLELDQYAGEQTACIAAHHGDQKAIDDCRTQVRMKWNRIWNSRFDGGFE